MKTHNWGAPNPPCVYCGKGNARSLSWTGQPAHAKCVKQYTNEGGESKRPAPTVTKGEA